MEFIKFFVIIIIASFIFKPIDKKYKLRLKYQNHLNKRFRLYIAITGLVSCAIELVIAFLSDDYLESIHISRGLFSFIFLIPMVFVLMVAMTPSVEE